MIKSTIVASRFFDDDKELFGNVSVDLPGLSFDAVDIKGAGVMGTLNIPSTGQIAGMEHVVHMRGMEADTDRLARPGKHVQEIRAVQDTYNPSTGLVAQEKIKVVVTGLFKSTEGGSIEPGAMVETSATYETLRIQKFVAGKETMLIDKVNRILKINGTDHWANVRSALS